MNHHCQCIHSHTCYHIQNTQYTIQYIAPHNTHTSHTYTHMHIRKRVMIVTRKRIRSSAPSSHVWWAKNLCKGICLGGTRGSGRGRGRWGERGRGRRRRGKITTHDHTVS